MSKLHSEKNKAVISKWIENDLKIISMMSKVNNRLSREFISDAKRDIEFNKWLMKTGTMDNIDLSKL